MLNAIVLLALFAVGCAPHSGSVRRDWGIDRPPGTSPRLLFDQATGLTLSFRKIGTAWKRVEHRNKVTGEVENTWLQSPDFLPADPPAYGWPPLEHAGYFTVSCDGRVSFLASAVQRIPTDEEWKYFYFLQGIEASGRGFFEALANTVNAYSKAQKRYLRQMAKDPVFYWLQPVELSIGAEVIEIDGESPALFHSEDNSWIDGVRFVGVRAVSEKKEVEAIYRILLPASDRGKLHGLRSEHCG